MSFIGPLFLWLQDREGLKREAILKARNLEPNANHYGYVFNQPRNGLSSLPHSGQY